VLQIPVLLGAVFLENNNLGALAYSKVIFSIIVLGMLGFYFFYGSGNISSDQT